MSWFDHLILPGSSPAKIFVGQRCLVVTRAGMAQQDLAALEKELGCRFVVVRPVASARKLSGPFKPVKGFCWSARIPEFLWCAEQDLDFLSPASGLGRRAAPGPLRIAL